MKTVTLNEIKSRGSKAFPDDGVSYVIVNSKPKSVLMPVDEYERMIEIIEEYEDVLAIEERKNEKTLSEKDFIEKYKDELQIAD